MKGPVPDAPKSAGMKIRIVRNGPYLVTGPVPLLEVAMGVDAGGYCHGWVERGRFPAMDGYALCRCGGSSNMPFCDGTHVKNHFDGTEKAAHGKYGEAAVLLEGPGLILADVESLCAGARFCHRGGGTWDLVRNSDDPEARRLAIEEACECPAGRLVARDKDGRDIEPEFEPSIALIYDAQAGRMGPIWVRGGIPIESADGSLYEVRNRVTLCRCGRSLNKPFCDGRHLL